MRKTVNPDSSIVLALSEKENMIISEKRATYGNTDEHREQEQVYALPLTWHMIGLLHYMYNVSSTSTSLCSDK